MNVYRTVVFHISEPHVGPGEHYWIVIHTCLDCLKEVQPEQLAAHALMHEAAGDTGA